MEWLWSKIKEGLEWIVDAWVLMWKSVFATIWDMLADVVSLLFDLLMEFAVWALDGIGQALDFDVMAIINALPSGMLNVMGALHLGTAFGIVAAAIVIRMLLQLIPFVRLGS